MANVVDFTPQGIKDVIAGDRSKGFRLGALTSAPTFTASPNFQDLTENIVGLNAAFKGAQQITRTDVTVEVELAELTHDNIQLIHPGLTRTDWLSTVNARLVVGTGNSQFAVTAKTPGVAGNSINFVISTPAGSTTTASFATSTVTVAPATTATAADVVAAINTTASTKAVVQAGLTSTSNGTGVVSAATSTPLAGGAAGTKIGATFDPKGYVRDNDYLENFVMALEGTNTDVLQIYVIFNAISNDEFSYQPDDEGNVSSIAATFTGHAGDASYDPATGVYLPPYRIHNLETPIGV